MYEGSSCLDEPLYQDGPHRVHVGGGSVRGGGPLGAPAAGQARGAAPAAPGPGQRLAALDGHPAAHDAPEIFARRGPSFELPENVSRRPAAAKPNVMDLEDAPPPPPWARQKRVAPPEKSSNSKRPRLGRFALSSANK